MYFGYRFSLSDSRFYFLDLGYVKIDVGYCLAELCL